MCYTLLLSTSSSADLSEHDDELLSFSRELPGLPEEALLAYHEKWFVGSRSGCSCGFRHLYVGSVDLGFGEPQDWYPEEPEDLEATLRFVRVVTDLLRHGARVDCIDGWTHGPEETPLAGTVEVDLGGMSPRAFRFFENHRFDFTAAAPSDGGD